MAVQVPALTVFARRFHGLFLLPASSAQLISPHTTAIRIQII